MQFHYTGDVGDPPLSSRGLDEPSDSATDHQTSRTRSSGEAPGAESARFESEPFALEDMVSELVDRKPKPKSPQRPSQFLGDSPSVLPEHAGSRPPSTTFTAQDLVKQMQQPSPSPQGAAGLASHRTSLPSIMPSPFTPRPGETVGSTSRPGTSHQPDFPGTAPIPTSREALEFQQQIAQMRQNIENRTSPVIPFDPTQSSHYETPTGLTTFLRNQLDQSPWESPIIHSSAPSADMSGRPPQASPFGAIGEPRSKSAVTPTSGQAA